MTESPEVSSAEQVHSALDQLGPEGRARVLAVTARYFSDLDLAEEVVQEAMVQALRTWGQNGVPRVPEAWLITAAKRRIRSLGISFEIPARAESWQRLAAVQRVVYMLYAEGFARSAGRAHTSDDMTTEAIRLARMLRDLLPGSAEVTGMLALLLLTQGRRPARTDDAGRPVPLAEQDRRRWDRGLIEEGLDLAQRAASSAGAASYAVQAAIAAVHAEAADVESTDWPQIAVLYRMLESYEPSPVVRLGRAVALGRAQGPRVGLEQMEGLAEEEMLQRYRPFHIARAMTLEELGEQEAAASSYRRALQLPGNTAEDAYLTELLTGLVGAQVPE